MNIFEIGNTLVQNIGKAWSYTKTADANRYELRGGDHAVGAVSDRSETESSVRWVNAHEINISYKFMIEDGKANSAAWLLIGQFFSSPGAGGSGWSPPFAVELAGEKMRFLVRSSTDAKITSNPIGQIVWKDAVDIDRGHWYDMDIRITFDPNGNGKLVVVRDGVELFTYRGPIGYADTGGYYWKEGLYRASSNETIAAQFADATVSYAATAAAGTATTFNGTAGKDTIWGTGGDDIMRGGAGDDKLYGHGGDDVIEGGDGNDFLVGMAGADRLDGGVGGDFADYSLSATGVTVSLETGRGQGGDAEGDTLISIEGVNGSKFDDVLIGDKNANYLDGGAGNDRIEGGLGGDIIYGRDGIDTAVYTNSNTGVTVSLVTGTGKGGHAEGDKIFDIENIEGSKFADKLIGNALDNVLTGGAGNDILHGGAGNDTLYGGAGQDVLIGGAGNDVVYGGDDTDLFLLSGNSKEYSYKFLADGRLQVTDKIAGRDGVDILDSIEVLSFRDGSVKTAEFRSEQITKHFDDAWKISSYDITVKSGNKVEVKHYDAGWKLQYAEATTTTGGTQIIRTYDSKFQQIDVVTKNNYNGVLTVQDYAADGKTLESTKEINVADIQETFTTEKIGDKLYTTTYDKAGAKLHVDVQSNDASGVVTKHYDGKMTLLSNSVVKDFGGYIEYKEYDAAWKLVDFHTDMAPTLTTGSLYDTGLQGFSAYADVKEVLTAAADGMDYLNTYSQFANVNYL